MPKRESLGLVKDFNYHLSPLVGYEDHESGGYDDIQNFFNSSSYLIDELHPT